MHKFIFNLHSGFRYVVFLLLIVALFKAITGWMGKKSYTDGDRKINLFAMISAHIQFVAGLVLYFYSPLVQLSTMGQTMKNSLLRYWTVEHLAMMLFAIALITVGHARSKRLVDATSKHRAVSIFYGLALLVIWVAIVQSGRPFLGK